MNLYIQIQNGQPINHPAFEENIIQAFGVIPLNWEPFVRLEYPMLNMYQVFNEPKVTYEKVDGVWTDVFHIREMTQEERAAVQKPAKDAWDALPNRENFSAWVFDENLCRYVPPVARPNDGKDYFWQGTSSSWVEKPQKPDDGKVYKLDYASATWVEVPQV
jgi:hypothetical protein